MLTIKAMAGGVSYAEHHLSHNDYYSERETITGRWMGRGAEMLGLSGDVTVEQFEAIRQSIDPATGEFLRQRHSADRYGEVERKGIVTVERKGKAINLYDCTISAPKAVSIQAMVDHRLITAHHTAVAETAREMERLAGTRVRLDGANENRFTSNLVIARYDHDTSRELDPQLHTHLVAANLTYDGVEGRWKALQPHELYAQRAYLTEVYRNALAREVKKLGYRIEDRFELGKDNGFGIAGIQEATLEKYSQRSAQRDQAIAEFAEENGRLPSDNEVAYLVRESRDEKLTKISREQVKAGQFARLEPEEARTLQDLHQAAQERGSVHEHAAAAPSLSYAREHVFERVSVAKDYGLKTEALRHGRGRIDLPELQTALVSEVATGNLLTAKGEVATKRSLDRERGMVAAIDEGIGKFQAIGRGREFTPSTNLREEQREAVATVLGCRDFAVNLQGAYGTGKTATLVKFQQRYVMSHRNVVNCQWAKAFDQFCSSHGDHPVSRSVLGA